MLALIFTQLLAFLVATTFGASTFEPARPPAIPLAVRSPYLSTWLEVGQDGGSGGYLAGTWPTFWTGSVTGWLGMVRVDGTSYCWMGACPSQAANVDQTSFVYTSTRSSFVMSVNNAVELNVTFLSPVFPNDYKRQSLTLSYLDVNVQSLDGAEHDVQVYSDISAEWVSGDKTAVVQWEYGVTGLNGGSKRSTESSEEILYPRGESNSGYPKPTSTSGYPKPSSPSGYPSPSSPSGYPKPSSPSGYPSPSSPSGYPKPSSPSGYSRSSSSSGYPKPSSASGYPKPTSTYPAGGLAYHKIFRQTQLAFSEVNDQTEYGYVYYATNNVANLTHQAGQDVVVRNGFIANGSLPDTEDTDFRAVSDDWPVFAFAIDLGSVGSKPTSTLFSIGLLQEQAVQFDGAQGNVTVPTLWTAYFSDELAALSFFHGDFSYAGGKCSSFDSKLSSDAVAAGGNDYYTITALAARQAFGATQLAGTLENMYMFMKEISSDGNVNTVDVIFPLHPILLYSNPELLELLLKPLYENQEAGRYPNAYSMHDLGTHYPNATGHQDGNDEMQPLEECGNMLIMTLAYAQRANNASYLNQHYAKLTQWTSFLVNESLIPANQISTDDFAGSLANQTNLAVKGIIGIEAMSQIASLTGHTADARNYSSIAHSYIRQWQNFSISDAQVPGSTEALPHTTLNYGNQSTYSLLYNLYGDRELGLNLVPQYVYDMESAFYPTVEKTYGVPLDTRHTYTKLDWQLFCASIASESTRNMFFSTIVKWINATPTNRALTDLYDTLSGDYPDGIEFAARPVVGGAYALLALNRVTNTIL